VLSFVYCPWGARAPEGSAACDGLVPGARLDLSHWSNNKTPAELKRDTSVEIALAFAHERGRHDLEIVVNNHFDTDGVLAVWSVLNPDLALAHASQIIGAAESGDFDEWPKDDRGLKLELSIARLAEGLDDGEAYRRILPALDDLVPRIEQKGELWSEAYEALQEKRSLIDRGDVAIERVGRIAVFAHRFGIGELPGVWIARLRPEGTDRVLLGQEDEGGRWSYRYELPRYAWADTVGRPALVMPRRGPIRRALGDVWVIKGRRGMTGIAYTCRPIEMSPGRLAERLSGIDRS
jgi:hypothetical protein